MSHIEKLAILGMAERLETIAGRLRHRVTTGDLDLSNESNAVRDMLVDICTMEQEIKNRPTVAPEA